MTENKNAKTPADGPEYERGFVEGMQRQMQLHVNRVINGGPTAWQCQCGKAYTVTCISSKPSKREWVGLTADEIWKCNKAKSGSAVEFHICSAHQNVLDFAESIEAKLKEKNT